MSKEEHRCEECGLHYVDEETADACYAYCKENQACNLELMKKSVEYQKLNDN